jgi:hypothetical protein
MRIFRFAALALLAGTGVVLAATAPQPFQNRTERLTLEGRRGPSLFRPGFAVGDYTGSATAQSSSTSFFGSSDYSEAEFDVATGIGEVKAECEGGQSHTKIIVTFDREDLSYVCKYSGAAPGGAEFSLVLARGKGLFANLQQPQRAGVLTWGSTSYRAETRYVSGLPWTGGGSVIGYVISRDGIDVGGISLGGLRPTFYLPPKGSPDRDAVAVLAISLFYFRDPGRPQ